MSANVKRSLFQLELLRNSSPKLVKEILSKADNNLILAICEICLNLCKDNINCDTKVLKKLRRHKTSIYRLATSRKNSKNLNKERSILLQKGGAFLPLLLTPVLGGLTEYLLRKAFEK